MPPVSQAQRRWAWANKDEPGKEGAAARKFAESDPGGKLPEHVGDKTRAKALYDHPTSRRHAKD